MFRLTSKLIIYRGIGEDSILRGLTEIFRRFEEGDYDPDALVCDIYDEVHSLLDLATKYGFNRNLWHNYLAYLIAVTETPFTLVSEKVGANEGSVNSFALNDFYVEGSVYPTSMVKESDLTYGHMPENDYEIVVSTNSSSDAYFSISNLGEEMIGAKVKMQDMGQLQTYDFEQPITVAGVIIDDSMSSDEDYSLYGYSTIYVSDKVENDLLISMMSSTSKSVLNFGGTKVANEYDRGVYESSLVPEGKVYIFDDQTYYYKDAEAEGKDFSLTVNNRFFESSMDFKVDKVITSDNIDKLLDLCAGLSEYPLACL